MPYKARQTVRRTITGKMFKRARKAAGVRVDQVVEKTGMSKPVVYRQEDGIAPVPVEMIPTLAELYQVSDPGVIAMWTKWANISATRGGWGSYGNKLGPTFEDYADVLSLAVEIRAFEPSVVHGLLQTRRYSEEIISASSVLRSDLAPLEDRLKFREECKKLLHRTDPPPPRLWVILGEAAVLTPPSAFDKTAHPEQIQRLLNLGDSSATIHMLPFESGLHPGLAGSFSILTLDDHVDIVFRDGYGEGSFDDDPDVVREYRTRYEQLIGQALSPIGTRQHLREMLKKWEN